MEDPMIRRAFAGLALVLSLLCSACGRDPLPFQGDDHKRVAERMDWRSATRSHAPVVGAKAEAKEPPAALLLRDPEIAAMRTLDSVSDPAHALASLKVRDPGGGEIGVVSAVQTGASGALEQLVIATDDGHALMVTPPLARFDERTRSVRLLVGAQDLAYRP
jgi:hypothetical protein